MPDLRLYIDAPAETPIGFPHLPVTHASKGRAMTIFAILTACTLAPYLARSVRLYLNTRS